MREHLRIESLQRKGLRIIRDTRLPGYTTDAVLLADFACAKARERVLDIGCGIGILPLLLLGRTESLRITAVEIEPALASLAKANMLLNKVEDRVEVLEMDAKELPRQGKRGSFGLVVCNPPYHKGGGPPHRHQLTLNYEQMAAIGFAMLRDGGRFCCCLPAHHLFVAGPALQWSGLEPKRLQPVTSKPGKAPYLVLLEAKRGARPGLSIAHQLTLLNADGVMSEEARRIYCEPEEKA